MGPQDMPFQSLELFVIWILCENMPRFPHGIKLKCSNLYHACLRVPTVFEAGLLTEVGGASTDKAGFAVAKSCVVQYGSHV